MNDIAELLDIISSLGGAASIDDITSAYAKKHKMPVSLIPKGILESTLSPNSTLVRFNRGTGEWALVVDTPFASPNSLTKKVCNSMITETLDTLSTEKFLAADQYQAKRKQTEFLLSSLCVGHSNVTIDTTRVKSTPVLIDNKRVMSIYYRSNAVRIDTVITSKLYRIAKELEAEGLAYQRPSANPYASSGTYAIFVNEKDEETVYKRLLGLN